MGGAEGTCIADKICSVFSFRSIGKRHIGTYYFQVVSNISDSVVCILRLFLVRQFHIIVFMTADYLFLGFDRKWIPCSHVVNVFLYEDVTATDKVRVLVTYHRKMIGILIYCRIFGTVHKTDDCFSIHIPESMSFIDWIYNPFQLFVDNGGKLKAESHLFCPDV